MRNPIVIPSRLLSVALILSLAAACADSTSPITDSPLSGLSKAATNDTSYGRTENGQGPGIISGTVVGPSPVGAMGDTLASAPRIPGTGVDVWVGSIVNGETILHLKVASTTTGSDGKFTLPELKAGQYIVIFTPPPAAGYHGVYVTGWVSENSSKYPWWIVLRAK